MLHSHTPLNITAPLKASFENTHWATCPLHRSNFCCNNSVRSEERWGTRNHLLLTHWDLGTRGEHKITWGQGFHTHATRNYLRLRVTLLPALLKLSQLPIHLPSRQRSKRPTEPNTSHGQEMSSDGPSRSQKR